MTSGATRGLHSEVLQTFSVEVQPTQKTAQLLGVQLNENAQNAQNLQSEHTCVIITQIEKLPEGPLVPVTPLASWMIRSSHFEFFITRMV